MAGSQARVALVVGNGDYVNAGHLANPCNDAKAIASALPAFGFEVIGGEKGGLNLDYKNFLERIRNFHRAIRNADVAMFFYAGHGLQANGHNYLVPVDAALKHEEDISVELIEIQRVLASMQHETRTSLVFLDACRNNPLAKNLARVMAYSASREAAILLGLNAEQKIAAGTLIAFATQPDHIAYDGTGNNGYFTEAFLECLKIGSGKDIEKLLRCVRGRVLERTAKMPRGPQVPWSHSSLTGEFSFGAPDGPVDDRRVEKDHWDEIRGASDVYVIERFLERFPKGDYADLAQDHFNQLIPACRDPDALERLLMEYPGSSRRESIERRLATLLWAKIRRQKDIPALEVFSIRFGAYAEAREARDRIRKLSGPRFAALRIRIAAAITMFAGTFLLLAMPFLGGMDYLLRSANFTEQGNIKNESSSVRPTPKVEGASEFEEPQAETDSLIQLAIRDGNKLMIEGDIEAARVRYRQAESRGSLEAALALGRSFDPSYFEKLPVKTGKPDPATAFEWYKKALEGGLVTGRVKIDGLKQWLQR